jgi:hypothetical protein
MDTARLLEQAKHKTLTHEEAADYLAELVRAYEDQRDALIAAARDRDAAREQAQVLAVALGDLLDNLGALSNPSELTGWGYTSDEADALPQAKALLCTLLLTYDAWVKSRAAP